MARPEQPAAGQVVPARPPPGWCRANKAVITGARPAFGFGGVAAGRAGPPPMRLGDGPYHKWSVTGAFQGPWLVERTGKIEKIPARVRGLEPGSVCSPFAVDYCSSKLE
jgi:hypothetical protein